MEFTVSVEGTEGLRQNLLENAQCYLTKLFWERPCPATGLHMQLCNGHSCAELPQHKTARARHHTIKSMQDSHTQKAFMF